MGKKGDKLTHQSAVSANDFVDRLSLIEGVTSRKMFGGHGIFHEGKMFGIINSKGDAFLKADDSTRPDFEQYSLKQHGKMPYFLIPMEIQIHKDKLIPWVKKAIAISK